MVRTLEVSDVGDTIITGNLNIGAALFVGTGIVSSGHIQTKNQYYIYPGRVDVNDGQVQGTWYLSSHGTYGLYTNTGLYVGANIWVTANSYLNAVTCAAISCSSITASSSITSAYGYGCRAGVAGPALANVFNFNWNGTVQAWIDASLIGSIAMTSDARIKRDFTPISNSLDKVLKMNPGTFYYKKVTDQDADPEMHLGMLAQEVIKFAPELVRNTGMKTKFTPDGVLQVNYVEMISVLVKAIQELNMKIEAH